MKIRSAKPEVKSLFFINLTGTLFARYLVPFCSVIDSRSSAASYWVVKRRSSRFMGSIASRGFYKIWHIFLSIKLEIIVRSSEVLTVFFLRLINTTLGLLDGAVLPFPCSYRRLLGCSFRKSIRSLAVAVYFVHEIH